MKRIILFISIIVVCIGSVFAASSYSPEIDGSAGATFTFPSSDYLLYSQGRKLPSMRTSMDINLDVMAANFRINNLEVGAGCSLLYNSRSLIAGIHFLRPYYGLGVVLGFQYHYEGLFSLAAKTRYLLCRYLPLKNRLDIVEFELVPAFDFIENDRFETSLTVPVTFCYKSDSVSARVGIGFDVQYNLVFGEENEEK